MTDVTTSDGVRLYAEATGSGPPILFIHEFAADHRTWARQVEALSGEFQCITYDARGYPPSEVPKEQERYSYIRQADDAIDVLAAFGVGKAHIVGLSMGGFCALQLGIRYPGRVSSLLVSSAGSGANPAGRAAFIAETEQVAAAFRARDRRRSPKARRRAGPHPAKAQDPGGVARIRQAARRAFRRRHGAHRHRSAAVPARPCTRSQTSSTASRLPRSSSTATKTKPAWTQGCCSSARSPPPGCSSCLTRGTRSTWRSRTSTTT